MIQAQNNLYKEKAKLSELTLEQLDRERPKLLEALQQHILMLNQSFVDRQEVIELAMLCILLGEPPSHPYAALFSFCLIFALLLHWVKSRTSVPYDALVGVFLAIAIAMGAALLLWVARKVNIHILENVLFGSILTVQDKDLLVLGIIAGVCLVLGSLYGNKALLASLNPELAQVNGINTKRSV